MSEESTTQVPAPPADNEAATAVKTKPAKPKRSNLPPWKVLLHNDDVNEMGYVVDSIMNLTTLNAHQALVCMLEAHRSGLSLLLTTHREHAELLQEQFQSKRSQVTIEPDE